MPDSIFGLILIFILAIGSSLILFICHKYELLPWIITWIYSSREEKVSLTRLKGLYNANGYLEHSDSDVHIGPSGSFRRFESIDKDIKIVTTSLSNDWSPESCDTIPPQPLRPAPQQLPQSTAQEDNVCTNQNSSSLGYRIQQSTETSIKPLPRPVSSVNMISLQQSNSQYISPPPPNSATTALKVSKTNDQIYKMDDIEIVSLPLKRAVSCESVCSESSVALGDLEATNITGYLCISLEYDSENGEMISTILEAKDLFDPSKRDETVNSYVKVFLLPDKNISVQTKIYKDSNSPSYQERVVFTLFPEDQIKTALLFHIYTTDNFSHTLLGEGELRLADINLRQPVTTWVTLTDTEKRGTEFGELMFSLSYLPTAERLTVVVVKARNLRFTDEKEAGDPFVKVYLLQHGKKMHKKKTSTRKAERSPIFNESMMFSIPAHSLQTIQLRLTVAESSNAENTKAYSIGHVIVGSQASGRPLSHWNQMLTALRKPVAMWHTLRK